MSKTVEELLKPRYKVINTWPGMAAEPFELDQIVNLEQHEEHFIHTPLRHLPESYMREDFFKTFPHLFKKLEWHQERHIEDLPLYLKDKDRIWKLKGWVTDMIGSPYPINFVDKEGDTDQFCSIAWHFRKDRMMPATEEEYNNYKSKKDGTVNG